jgi:hypothetical protein
MSAPQLDRISYFAWLLVALPLGVWMVVGHSDIAAVLFMVAALGQAAARHHLKRRWRTTR